MHVEVVHKGSHYEVRIDGDFLCTADTIAEATRECHEYIEGRKANEN